MTTTVFWHACLWLEADPFPIEQLLDPAVCEIPTGEWGVWCRAGSLALPLACFDRLTLKPPHDNAHLLASIARLIATRRAPSPRLPLGRFGRLTTQAPACSRLAEHTMGDRSSEAALLASINLDVSFGKASNGGRVDVARDELWNLCPWCTMHHA